jgi:hypothetical protein
MKKFSLIIEKKRQDLKETELVTERNQYLDFSKKYNKEHGVSGPFDKKFKGDEKAQEKYMQGLSKAWDEYKEKKGIKLKSDKKDFDFKKKMKTINNLPRLNTKHSDQTKQHQKNAAQGRYTLKWFQTKYGNDEGERRYTERNRRLSTRYINDKNEQWLSELTPTTLLVLLQQKTQEQIKQDYNVTHKRLYKKYQEFWGCNTYSEVKKRLL